MPTPQFYPALNNLVSSDKLPEPFKAIVENVSNKLFYKGYYAEKSIYGEAAYHHIVLVFKKETGFKLFGGEDGFEILFNPNIAENTTEIPLTLYYNLPILKYVRQIKMEDLNSVEDYFNLILEMFEISKQGLLFEAIDVLFNGYSDPINTFIIQFNTNADYSLYPPLENPTSYGEFDEQYDIISDIVVQFEERDINIYLYLLENYIDSSNLSEGFEKLKQLFKRWLGDFTFETFINLFVPKISVSVLQLEVALAFPRTWLKPVHFDGQVIEDESIKSMLTYSVGSISYHSENGFEFINPDSFNLDRSQIGNTGMLIEIQNLKFDFRTDKNIPEAVADGRPDSFKGVYIEYAAITLPPKWFNDDEVVGGITAKIAGYNMLIGTGGLSGTIALETQTFRNSDGTIINYYTDYFQFEYPIQTTHKDAGNNLVITDIPNDSALTIQLENFEATQFIFPLSLTKNGESSPTVYLKASEYYNYLNTLYNHSDENNRPRLSKRFGSNGFEIWFTSFNMTFQQNHIIESNIQGGLKIPKLKDANGNIANIDIYGHLDDDGGFNITASEQDGFQPIKIPNVLDIYVNSLEVGRESSDDPFYIGTACDIVFTNEVINSFIGEQRISIERLRIYSDGSFEIVGGAIAVPTNFTINLGPVEISITGINFGSFQEEDDNGDMRKYNFFGFDGGISLGSIGVEARGEGVKYFYTVDDGPRHSFIRIETIEVDLTIPGNASAESATAIIKGWLSISEVEYAGGVSLKLPKLKMAGGADMRLQPKPPAFIIDAYLDIPIPIPLAATGLGITGFRGLAGFKYVAEKEAIGLNSHEDKWYDYYVYPPRGVHVSKFNGPDKSENATNAFSLGAGVTLATMGSSDVISLRIMVLLSIPNMFMIDGRGSILSKQWGLDDSGEPPFFAFMILAENGIEVGAGVDFKLPQNSGSIVDLHVYMQAGYFWDNPSGWYLNLGTREDPITAKILSLVEMESFLMLSASGIEAGARISFDINERFGPIGVRAWLLAEVGGFISFERPQIGGYMTVDAGARVDLFGIITVEVSFFTHFLAEAAKPFLIYAEIRVCGRIKILFVKIKICATVKLKWEKSREVDASPIPPIDDSRKEQAVKGIHMLTGETFDVVSFGNTVPPANSALFDTAIIPMDTYVDIKFDKAVIQHENITGTIGSYNNPPENYEDLIPPVKVIKGNEMRQVKHRYQIVDIKIKAAKEGSNTWVDYHPYEAVAKPDSVPPTVHLSELHIGHWQKSSKEYNAIRILATSPFSYTEQGEPGWFIPEQLGLTPSSLFCEGEEIQAKCANWLDTPLNTSYNTVNHFPYYHTHQEVFFNVSQGQTSTVDGIVINSRANVVNQTNIFGFTKSLEFPNTSSLDFKLPQSSTRVTLKLSTNAQSIKVIYYKSFVSDGGYLVEYLPITSVDYLQAELSDIQGVTYINEETPISKIKIIPVLGATQNAIDDIYEQIQQLFNDTYEQFDNNLPEGVNVEIPLDSQTYFDLLNQLESIQNQSCSPFQEECVKDEKLCALHKKLSEIFPARYPSFIESIEDILDFISIYQDFVNIIYGSLSESFIENNLQPQLNKYRLALENIINNQNTNGIESEYYILRENAQLIINRLNQLGNCDCFQNNDDCDDKDEVVCNFYEELNTIFQSCIQPTENLQQIQQNLNCVLNFNNAIKRFASQNPQYDLYNYLNQNYTYLFGAYNDLVAFFNGNGGLTENQAIEIYNTIVVVYSQIIVNLVSQLGNCNCENQQGPSVRCTTLLHSICWLSVEDWTYNLNIPSQTAIQEDYQATIDAINYVIDPIWRPNTKYYIEFSVKDIVNDTDQYPPFKYYYGFKTVGTLGHYHNAPNVIYGNEYNPITGELLNRDEDGKLTNPDQYALTSLEQYIDYRRSYPNADGNLLQSKPLFYSAEKAKLLLFYIKPYVAHMFKDQWDAYNGLDDINNDNGLQALKVFVQDPVSNVIMEHPMPPDVDVNTIPQTIETWSIDDHPSIPMVLNLFEGLLGAQSCTYIGPDTIDPASQFTTIELHNLKPRKMYTAIFTNTFENVTKKVHHYGFQTSRYSNFLEQVNSYKLEVDDGGVTIARAVFNINLNINAQQINEAYDLLTADESTNDTQEAAYIDFMDRILEGTFKMIPLDPPVTTEFNVIRNQNTNDAVAILIRNPEPFNDPKIPLEIIKGIEDSQDLDKQGTIAVMQDNLTKDLNFSVLYSKDYSQALIMHSSKKIIADSLNIRFQYKLWNGNEYQIEDAVPVENLVLNPEN